VKQHLKAKSYDCRSRASADLRLCHVTFFSRLSEQKITRSALSNDLGHLFPVLDSDATQYIDAALEKWPRPQGSRWTRHDVDPDQTDSCSMQHDYAIMQAIGKNNGATKTDVRA